MIQPADTYKIGTLTRTHGLRGELVFQFTDDVFDRADADYLLVEVEGILTPFYIEEYRFRSDDSVLIAFEDIDDVEAAQSLTGCDVYVERALRNGDEEEVMSLDAFVGLRLYDQYETEIGEIVDVNDQTENWLFVVQRPNGEEVLIPAHEELIADLRLEEHRITMNLPEGLLSI